MGFSPSHPRHPRPLPRGPRMSARVTLPLAVHRPPDCRCACAVTGPPRGVSPAKVTALCAVARVVIGTVNLDFFWIFFYFRRTVEFCRRKLAHTGNPGRHRASGNQSTPHIARGCRHLPLLTYPRRPDLRVNQPPPHFYVQCRLMPSPRSRRAPACTLDGMMDPRLFLATAGALCTIPHWRVLEGDA